METSKLPEIKRRQHYIWRKYLTSWTTDGVIDVYFKKQNKVISTDLMKVGLQSFFYEVEELSQKELNFAIQIVKRNSPSILIDGNIKQLKTFQSIFDLEKKLTVKNQADPSLLKLFKTIKINMGEEWQSIIENIGAAALELALQRNLSFYLDLDTRNDFCYFLTTQYTRTKYIQDSIVRAFGGDTRGIRIERFWKAIKHPFATNMAFSMALKMPSTLNLLINNTGTKLITNDQPVVNLLFEQRDSKGITTDVQFYYPISPSLALLFNQNSEYSINSRSISEDEVFKYNKFMFKNSLEQVYGINKSNLDIYQHDIS